MADPSQMLWHNSALSVLNHCEQKFTYAYLHELEPVGALSLPLVRGSWFHALRAAQGLKQGLKQGTLLEVPTVVNLGHDALSEVSLVQDGSGEWCFLVEDHDDAEPWPVEPRAVHEMWLAHVHDFLPTDDEEWEALPDEVWFLYQRYLAAHLDDLRTEQVLLVEHQWSRVDEFDNIDGEPVIYGGRVDRVVRNAQGIVVVRDHKTTSQLPAADLRLIDSQLHLYAWGLAPLLDEHGLEVLGVEYDYARTGLGTVRLTKAGKLYANQAVMDGWAFEELLGKAVAEYNHGGGSLSTEDFSAVITKMYEEGTSQFFIRSLMPVNETVVVGLLDANRRSVEVARSLYDEGPRHPARRNPGRHCSWCEFEKLCTGDLYGNDTSLLRAEFTHRDIEVAS